MDAAEVAAIGTPGLRSKSSANTRQAATSSGAMKSLVCRPTTASGA
jgi:hypothetical protein